MDLLIFVMIYLTFMILILAFSQYTDRIRNIYGRQSIVAITAFSVAMMSIVVILLEPFIAYIGGYISILLGMLGIFHVYLYEEITKGYVISALAIITGFTIFILYFFGYIVQ